MEKILLAIDPEHVDIPAVEFACYVASLSRSKLTAVVLSAPVCAVGGDDLELVENLCSNHSVRSELQYLDTAKDLITESRFADLIITPAALAGKLLVDAECPVLVAPKEFNGIDEIIFLYDGSKSSVQAIKQFTYLFPRLSDKRAMILEVTEQANSHLTAKDSLRELLKAHYSGIGFHIVHGKAADEIVSYLIKSKTSVVVTGEYGKQVFSKLRLANCPFFVYI